MSGRIPAQARPVRSAAGPRLTLVPGPTWQEGTDSPADSPSPAAWGPEAWRETAGKSEGKRGGDFLEHWRVLFGSRELGVDVRFGGGEVCFGGGEVWRWLSLFAVADRWFDGAFG